MASASSLRARGRGVSFWSVNFTCLPLSHDRKYKWRAKMIFVRPTRNKWAGGVVPLCDILVHRVSRSPKKRRRSACVTPTGGATWRTAFGGRAGLDGFPRQSWVGSGGMARIRTPRSANTHSRRFSSSPPLTTSANNDAEVGPTSSRCRTDTEAACACRKFGAQPVPGGRDCGVQTSKGVPENHFCPPLVRESRLARMPADCDLSLESMERALRE